MRSNIAIKNKLTLVSQMQGESCFQILKYPSLKCESNLFKDNKENEKTIKQVRIVLDESCVKIEESSLSYIKGYIKKCEDKKIKKGIFGFINKEKKEFEELKDIFEGSGEILLKPSFDDFTLIELVDEEIIICEEIFQACDDKIEVSLINDDINKIKLSGSGVVVLKLPVPQEEVIRCKLYKDKLITKDDIVILISSNIKVAQEKYEKTIEEELVEEVNNVYSGIGEVWILATKSIYDEYMKRELFYNEDEKEY